MYTFSDAMLKRARGIVVRLTVDYLSGIGLNNLERINFLNICMFILFLRLNCCREENLLSDLQDGSLNKTRIQGERDLRSAHMEIKFPSNRACALAISSPLPYEHSVSKHRPGKGGSRQEYFKIFH